MAVESPDAPEFIPPPPAEPPLASQAEVGPTSTPTPVFSVAPARPRRSLLWYGALTVAVVITLGAFGLLFADDQSWQREAAKLHEQNASLHAQMLTAQTSAADAEQQVKALQAELKHPNLGLWNVSEKINGPDWYLAGGVPDTFTYHLNATSTGPMSVSILTFEQFAAAIECVDAGTGNANRCMHHSSAGTVMSWLDVRTLAYDFHQAEGCAGYMVVFTAAAAVTVMPDVSVTYNPAPTFTGVC
jgi:hypothetical protein